MVALARKLTRYPVNGRKRSLRDLAVELESAGHVSIAGTRYGATAVARMVASRFLRSSLLATNPRRLRRTAGVDENRTSWIGTLDLAGRGRLRRLDVETPEMFVNFAGTGPAFSPPAAPPYAGRPTSPEHPMNAQTTI
jgi:hypothetical protein